MDCFTCESAQITPCSIPRTARELCLDFNTVSLANRAQFFVVLQVEDPSLDGPSMISSVYIRSTLLRAALRLPALGAVLRCLPVPLPVCLCSAAQSGEPARPAQVSTVYSAVAWLCLLEIDTIVVQLCLYRGIFSCASEVQLVAPSFRLTKAQKIVTTVENAFFSCVVPSRKQREEREYNKKT